MKIFLVLVCLITLIQCSGNSVKSENPIIKNLTVIWSTPLDLIDTPDTNPLIVNDLIIYSGGLELEALNINTGEKEWGYEIGERRAINSKYLGYEGLLDFIYFSHDEEFTVLDSRTGRLELIIPDIAHSSGGHTSINDGFVIIGDTVDGYQIDLEGSIRQVYSIDMATSSVNSDGQRLFFSHVNTVNGGLTLGRITAIDLLSNDILWEYDTDHGGFSTAKPILENDVIYAGSRGNSPYTIFLALDSKTGEAIWEYKTNNPFEFAKDIILGSNAMYCLSNSYVFALDKNTGQKIWSFDWTGTTSVNMVYSNGYVYLSNHGAIFILDAQTGELVHEEPLPEGNGYFWRLAITEDKLFAQTSTQLIAYEPWHLRGD